MLFFGCLELTTENCRLSRLKTFLFFRSFSLTCLSGTLPDPSAFEVATLWRYTNMFIIIYYYFLTPVLSSQGMKKILYAIQKSTKIKLE